MRSGEGIHILIVSSVPDPIRSAINGLTSRSRCISVAKSSASVQVTLRQFKVDIVLLDLVNPLIDIDLVLNFIREDRKSRIVMIGEPWYHNENAVWLDFWVDDFVTAPFDVAELGMRIDRVIRRQALRAEPLRVSRYRFNGWELDVLNRVLRGSQKKSISLSGLEFNLLSALLSNANAVLTRTQLVKLVYKRDLLPNERGIDIAISRLRHVLNQEPNGGEVIKTVYARGYVMAAKVERE